jgi:hypothetical protein
MGKSLNDDAKNFRFLNKKSNDETGTELPLETEYSNF